MDAHTKPSPAAAPRHGWRRYFAIGELFRTPSLQLRLLAIAALGLLPMAILSMGILARSVDSQRAAIGRANIETARALMSAVDTELDRSVVALQTLAASPRLAAGDLAAFHAESAAAVKLRPFWRNIQLLDPAGEQVLNTRYPLGSSLPRTNETESLATVLRTAQPKVSDLVVGAIGGQHLFAVRVPVQVQGELRYVLGALVRPDSVQELLARQNVPADSLASVLDARGDNVARSRDHSTWVGKPVSPSVQALARRGREGWGPAVSLDGERMYAAYAYSDRTGWSVAIGIPREAIDTPVRSSYLALGGAFLFSLLLGLLGARVGARAILRPMRALQGAAQAVGRGEEPAVPDTPIAEIREAATALVHAQSQRAGAEHALRERADELARLIELLPIGIVIAHDIDGAHVTGNRAAAEILRGSAEGSLGGILGTGPAGYRVLRDGRELSGDEMPIRRAARGQEVRGEESELVFDDGTVKHVMAFATPLPDGSGKPRGAVAAFLDITGRRRAEEALQDSDRRKDEFLAMLSHELRNPLAAISNAVTLLSRESGEQPRARRVHEILHRQTRQLARIVDDLLDVARISHGNIPLRMGRVRIDEVLRGVAADARGAMESGEHRLSVLAEGDMRVHGDEARLTQVFSNLLDNASKYSEPGGRIQVTAAREGGEVVVRVRDSGMGMPAELLPRIFDLFTQGSRTLDRSHGGLGIGLTIVKKIVEMHGGRVEVTSDGCGKGSEFIVRLPAADDETRSAPSPGGRGALHRLGEGAGLRILLVEDHADSARALASLLELEGHDTEIAFDGEEALRKADHSQPDVVLLDIGLPRMSGLEVCRALRSRPWCRTTRVIALTGWGQEEDKRQAREAGFDGHLLKPVDHAELMELLAAAARAMQPIHHP
jgi:PAS domain S-box-containing protein